MAVCPAEPLSRGTAMVALSAGALHHPAQFSPCGVSMIHHCIFTEEKKFPGTRKTITGTWKAAAVFSVGKAKPLLIFGILQLVLWFRWAGSLMNTLQSLPKMVFQLSHISQCLLELLQKQRLWDWGCVGQSGYPKWRKAQEPEQIELCACEP